MKLGYKDLGPNTVVFEIFIYLEYPWDLKTRNLNVEFGAFGLFTLDQLRNIWFLFRSVIAGPGPYGDPGATFRFIIDWKRVEHLSLCDDYLGKMKYKVNQKMPVFNNLISLTMDYNEEYSMLQSSYHKFPKLKNLKFHNLYRVASIEWNDFPQLECLVILNSPTSAKWFKGCKFEQLKKLDIEMSPFYETIVYSMINLEELRIRRSPITDVIFQRDFSKLRILEIEECDAIKGIEWSSTLDQITYLHISYCRNIHPRLFEDHKFTNLKKCILGNGIPLFSKLFVHLLKNIIPKKCILMWRGVKK